MFEIKTTSLNDAGVLNDLLKDYIGQKKNLSSFYNHFPNKEGFTQFFKENTFNIDRPKLAAILTRQAFEVTNTSEQTSGNIELLKHENVFTVTTGHQLCLFTGPLYFIYKIFSAINLADELNKLFPEKKFVPVYWAATEDHDFEEINHFNAFNKTIRWETIHQGAVGNLPANELIVLFSSVRELFGSTDNGNFLSELFERSYLNHPTLASATRFLVNELFGQYGLITVDGNDIEFKQQFRSQFKKDIFDNSAFEKVNQTIWEFQKLGYSPQVNPRPINCFYIEKELRARIERENETFKIIGTAKTFSAEELNALIENNPEKISPNVVLRPVYQQSILPNAAYVGGPGELAYWLEYKNMFKEFGATFPVLVPRSFITLVDKNTSAKINKLGFSIEDIFKDEQELIKTFQVNADIIFELGKEKEEVEKLYSSILKKIEEVDKTLTGTVSAEQQKALNSLDVISAKANRALKQKSETEINQVKGIKEKLFPGKIPQERHENFSSFYIKWGDEFFKILKENIHPLQLTHLTLIEQ
ncbi:MAG: bacillithiol biosynthesis cysteine-adding enzyme BshC [Bacteroidia bacterium]